jgi:hypothetical protein
MLNMYPETAAARRFVPHISSHTLVRRPLFFYS